MRVATREDFHGGAVADDYRRYDFFRARAELLRAHFPTARAVLVAGCGWGFLVEELRAVGLQAWGCDLSDYGLAQATLLGLGPFVFRADATSEAALLACVAAADPPGVLGGQFDLVVTEDLLPACEDAGEVRQVLRACRRAGRLVAHLVTCEEAGRADERREGWLWLPRQGWAGLVTPDLLVDADLLEVV